MIKNFWNNVKFYCIHEHPKPVLLVPMEGESTFYACPKYMLQDEAHPDGHLPDERQCANRISFTRAQSVIDRFMKIVEEDTASGDLMDYTNMKFSFDGIDVKILKYSPDDTRIGIVNRRALH